MTQTLAKYLLRAPRYTLSPEENNLIRVVGPQLEPWEEHTDIRNVSLTGLSFTADPSFCPRLGEIIRIQFTVPGSSQMACHAIVTRLEQLTPEQVLVGVHFYKLDMAHRINLARGLADKFGYDSNHEESGVIDLKLDQKKKKFLQVFILLLIWFTLTTLIFSVVGLK